LTVKFYPVFMNLFLFIFQGLFLIGVKIPVSDYMVFFVSQCYLFNREVWVLSKIFKLCAWHRIMLLNMTVCLTLQLLYTLNLIDARYPYITIY